MTIEKIPLVDTAILPALLLDYLSPNNNLQALYKYQPNIASFESIIKEKIFDAPSRINLVETLKNQYKNVNSSDATKSNIESLLDEKTFSITTAHQPLLFGGPAYFIYKIASTIKTCRLLKAQYPGYTFVPVYWMGSEDHDFEEVNHLFLFNKKYSWERESTGPVGRLILDESIESVFQKVSEVLGESSNAIELKNILKDSFQPENTLADGVQKFVNALFSAYGLVILNQDDAQLKEAFKQVIKQELIERNSIQLIQETLTFLSNHYKIQATPRDINLFYHTDTSRERIIFEEGKYKINNSTLEFTQEEILKLADESPERFSPNVILRPLFQEMMLPNLAFVGGAGELSYWLQLKPLFQHYNVNYPMLLMRDTAMVWDEKSKQKFLQQGFGNKDIFRPVHELEKQYIETHAEQSISLDKYKKDIITAYEHLSIAITNIDKTLLQSAEAEKQKIKNGIDMLESKLLKAYKRKYDEDLLAIKNTKDKIFPEGILQERHDSFLMYYIKYGPALIDILINHFNVFEQEMTIVS
jgi:bacillithiol biosynthesis cysteine-adding enzyme BshC